MIEHSVAFNLTPAKMQPDRGPAPVVRGLDWHRHSGCFPGPLLVRGRRVSTRRASLVLEGHEAGCLRVQGSDAELIQISQAIIPGSGRSWMFDARGGCQDTILGSNLRIAASRTQKEAVKESPYAHI